MSQRSRCAMKISRSRTDLRARETKEQDPNHARQAAKRKYVQDRSLIAQRRNESRIIYKRDYRGHFHRETGLFFGGQRPLFRAGRRGLRVFLIARACTRSPIAERGWHVHQPPPTSEQPPPSCSAARWPGCNISRKGGGGTGRG